MSKIDFGTTGPQAIAILAATGKFTRNARSQILFEVGPQDWVCINSKTSLMAILEETRLVAIDDSFLRLDGGSTLWSLVNSHKWLLPRTGGKPTVRHQ
jgi:hypothetical protein